MKLSEIADMLNLSTGTVSMALNDSPKVKIETRTKVQQFAKMVNYSPSAVARSLVMKRTKSVGIILGINVFSPYYALLGMAVQRQLRSRGYLGVMLPSDNTMDHIHACVSRRMDGIMAPHMSSEAILAVRKNKIPLVIYDEKPELPVDYVVADRYQGGYLATEHLIKLGYRKIGFVCAVEQEARFLAYRAALHDALVPYRSEWVGFSTNHYRYGYEVMKKLLAGSERPEAVVCHNDMSAMGALRALREAGLKVPDDMAIVGFDNMEESEYGYIPLTTIDQPKEEIAKRAVDVFFHRLKHPLEESFQQIVLDVKLIVRESCGATLRSQRGVPSV